MRLPLLLPGRPCKVSCVCVLVAFSMPTLSQQCDSTLSRTLGVSCWILFLTTLCWFAILRRFLLVLGPLYPIFLGAALSVVGALRCLWLFRQCDVCGDSARLHALAGREIMFSRLCLWFRGC